jgi:polar amino acid transport system permease protein
VAFWYLLVVTVMSIGQHFLERYYGRSDRRDDNPLAGILDRALSLRRARA